MLQWGLDLTGSGYGPLVMSCEQGNETSGSVKGREFLNQLNDCQFFKKGSALWGYLVRLVC
jgi:hypothetical protein